MPGCSTRLVLLTAAAIAYGCTNYGCLQPQPHIHGGHLSAIAPPGPSLSAAVPTTSNLESSQLLTHPFIMGWDLPRQPADALPIIVRLPSPKLNTPLHSRQDVPSVQKYTSAVQIIFYILLFICSQVPAWHCIVSVPCNCAALRRSGRKPVDRVHQVDSHMVTRAASLAQNKCSTH